MKPAKTTKIEWCHRVWNPIVGCSRISEGCDHCYAERFAMRHVNNPATRDKYTGTADQNGWTGKVKLHENSLMLPFSWKEPAIVFVDSMGDLFHENADFRDIEKVMDIIRANGTHTFLALTKRISRASDY